MKKYKTKTSKPKLLIPVKSYATDVVEYVKEFDRLNLLKPMAFRVRGQLVNWKALH